MRNREEIIKTLEKLEINNADSNTDMVQVFQNRVIIELLLDIRDKLK